MHQASSLIAVVLGLLLAASLHSQESRCAGCHFAHPESPSQRHLFDWQASAHGRAGVGCEGCHGGDPSTFDGLRAHDRVLSSNNPASPTHSLRLPITCGKCHPGQLISFRKSRHFELDTGGESDAPTCSTCHGSVAAFLMSPRGLERQCRACHGETGSNPRAGYSDLAARLHSEVTATRELLRSASRTLRRVKEAERRRELEALLGQAEVPLLEVVEAAHSFDLEDLDERLAVARRRAEELLERVANP